MSDIQKLHRVIENLEEQSSKVSEFNGVLSAVNSAKEELAGAKEAFAVLSDEQQKLVTDSYSKFDEFGAKLAALESCLAALETKMVSSEQFEAGRDKTLLRLSELRVVTPEQFEKGVTVSEKNIMSKLDEIKIDIQGRLDAQKTSIKWLRTLIILGFAVLAGGILFLAKDAFI